MDGVDRVVGCGRLLQGQTALQSDYWQTAEGSRCRYLLATNIIATSSSVATTTNKTSAALQHGCKTTTTVLCKECNPTPAQFRPGLGLVTTGCYNHIRLWCNGLHHHQQKAKYYCNVNQKAGVPWTAHAALPDYSLHALHGSREGIRTSSCQSLPSSSPLP